MISNINYKIRYVNDADKDFWFSLDKHLSVAQFEKKVRDRQGYILSVDDTPIAIRVLSWNCHGRCPRART